jgi:hypothetical protein
MICIAATALLFPGGPLGLWLSLPPGIVSVCLLAAPVAALASILFPKVVDLNSVGRGSNAHGLAGLMCLAAFVVSAAPPLLLTLLASAWLHRPELSPVFVLLWCGVALVVSRLLFIPLKALLARRRENLGLVAG